MLMRPPEAWRSSASWPVTWALALKKLPYESVLVDIDRKEHFDVLAPYNPIRQLPTQGRVRDGAKELDLRSIGHDLARTARV